MEYRTLGRTGLSVSALGYGCGAVGGLMTKGDPGEQRRAVAHAYEQGITYFDTAPGYGDGASETNLGRVLKELGLHDKVVVGTKVRLAPADTANASAAITASIDASLARLGRSSVDLLQLHTPVTAAADGQRLPVAEVLDQVASAMDGIKSQGKAAHVGFTGIGDTAALHNVISSGRYEAVQSYFNLVNPSSGYAGHAGTEQDFEGLIDKAAAANLGVIAIRVMAAGILAGSPHANAGNSSIGQLVSGYSRENNVETAGSLSPLVASLRLEDIYELALRFVLGKREVSTALVGFSSFIQLQQALKWAEKGPLPAGASERVLALAQG